MVTKEYMWKRALPVDAHAAVRELETLGWTTEGFTPERMEQAAQSPTSVFHSLLTWDNDEAGKRWRIQECSDIVRNLVVKIRVTGAEDVIVRAVVRCAEDNERKGRYWEVERALTDRALSRGVLEDAARDAHAMAQKYRNLAYFCDSLAVYADRLDDLGRWIQDKVQDEVQNKVPESDDGEESKPKEADDSRTAPFPRITKSEMKKTRKRNTD